MKSEIINNTIKKAVIYCRVSTKEQVDEGNSLVSQERICREYAFNEGYDVAEVFIEKGESAKTADRKELQRLLSFCTKKKGTVQAVIAYKVDRVSRNIADYSYIRVQLKKAEVEIKSVTEFFEDTPAGRFMENIIANVGQFDNEVRTERCVGGMKEAVQEGRYVWKAPLGYDNVKLENKSTIAPNGLAPLVKETFELIAQRAYPTEVIRLMMAEKGLSIKSGAVNKSYFFRLIRNPLYKGVIKKFGKVTHGTFEPIIAEPLFDTVQAILKGRMNKIKHYLKENPDFPLRRFVLNPEGKQLTGYWSKGKRLKYPYYSFHEPGTTIRKDVLEKKFMDLLCQYAFDTTHFNVLRTHLENHFGRQVNNERYAHNALEKRMEEINQQIDNLIKLHFQDAISTNIFTNRTKKLENELDDLQDLLKARTTLDVNVPDLLNYVADVLKNPHLFWERSTIEIRRKLQVFDFPNGVIFDGINLRTPKVCRLFKLKELIDEDKFPEVDSGIVGNNTQSTEHLPPYDEMLLNSKAFWETVVTELATLHDISAEKEEQTQNQPYEEING